MSFEHLLIELVIILAAAKIGGELAERIRQPAVLGELIAGILVGVSVLGQAEILPGVGPFLARTAISPKDPVLHALAEIGAVLLLFEAGLESDIEELRRLGFAALWVACIGVAFPFAFGYGVALLVHETNAAAIFLGATLTATSVGITARTFSDLKMQERPEAKIVLGAAVADDVLGLIILALVSGLVGGNGESPRSPFVIVGLATLFLLGSVWLGVWVAPYILYFAARMRARAALATTAVIFCFLLAGLANLVGGLAPIVGAFAAGLLLSRTEHKLHFEERIKPIADIFIPIFFILMGAAMPVSSIDPTTAEGRATIVLALALTVVAVIGKVLAGLTVPAKGVSRLLVGIGMIPRGEVGLIFASVGLSKGLITQSMFTASVLMVMLTTFVTPPLLKRFCSASRQEATALPV